MNSSPLPGRRVTLGLAGLIALASMIVVLAVAGTRESHAAGDHDHAHAAALSVRSRKAVAFHDQMRALCETHGGWTHMVIVSFVGNLPNLAAEEQVLPQNRVDIGNAVKPYYGPAAGNKLTKLLKEHILGAVNVLVAATSGDPSKLAQADAAWFANGRQIAGLLRPAEATSCRGS